MAQVKGKDTTPEVRIRRLVHGMGYRYRLHRSELPGKPDLTFPSRRKVIFVHGCFWHAHDCEAGRNQPRSNRDYWLPKLSRNKARDAANQAKLRELGWRVLVVWECELANPPKVQRRIARFLEAKPL